MFYLLNFLQNKRHDLYSPSDGNRSAFLNPVILWPNSEIWNKFAPFCLSQGTRFVVGNWWHAGNYQRGAACNGKCSEGGCRPIRPGRDRPNPQNSPLSAGASWTAPTSGEGEDESDYSVSRGPLILIIQRWWFGLEDGPFLFFFFLYQIQFCLNFEWIVIITSYIWTRRKLKCHCRHGHRSVCQTVWVKALIVYDCACFPVEFRECLWGRPAERPVCVGADEPRATAPEGGALSGCSRPQAPAQS